jgi:SNF2 family DNA or RNA helicase
MGDEKTYHIETNGTSLLAKMLFSDIPPDTSWKRNNNNKLTFYYKELSCKEAYQVIRDGTFESAILGIPVEVDSSVTDLEVINSVLIPGIVFKQTKNRISIELGFKNPATSEFLELGPCENISSEKGYAIYRGKLFAFDPEGFDNLEQALEEGGGISRVPSKNIVSYRQYLKFKKFLIESEIPFSDSFSQDDFLIHLKKESEQINLNIPDNIEFKLYPYQEQALKWLQFCYKNELGCILADDMGLGKTKTVIALLAYAAKGPNIVICPSTLLANWARELRTSCPSIRFSKYHGPDRVITKSSLSDTDLILTSYGTFKNDSRLLSEYPWNIVVLDEAQKIKNPDTELRNAVSQMHFRSAVAVTGTPFENQPGDLWSLMDFIEPGFLGSRDTFERELNGPIKGGDQDAEAYLQEKVSLFMLRRLKKDVLSDLPDKIEVMQPIEMSLLEAENYRKQIKKLKKDNSSSFLGQLVFLRQICCHPFLSSGEEISDPSKNCNKYQRLVEILFKVFQSKEKALIFTSFHSMNDLLYRDLVARFDIPAFQLDGRVPIKSRSTVIDNFSDVSGAAVMILNPIVGGVGLNLVAANHVIHYNREWNPAVENQATDRVYRIGQQNKVFVHYLFYEETIDAIISDRLHSKSQLAQSLVQKSELKEQDSKQILEALRLVPRGLPEEKDEGTY